MDKKKIMIIGGVVVAAAAIAYFVFFRKKKNVSNNVSQERTQFKKGLTEETIKQLDELRDKQRNRKPNLVGLEGMMTSTANPNIRIATEETYRRYADSKK